MSELNTAAGTAPITIVTGCVALGSAPFAAVTLKVNEPAVVGMPAMAPVDAFRVSPGGNVPLEVHVAGAVPLAVNEKL